MMKIVALNEDGPDEESNDEGIATNEAQETIAESEYIRALKLKYNGKVDAALKLLNELLETKVLNEMCVNSKEEKLWGIRYNCHKNIAIIYEEKQKYDLALLNYLSAMQIDKTDVHMLHKFGQLALKCNVLEQAECAFENCLKRNPQHWNAADGLLRTLCQRHNIFGAYGWALKLYRRDSNYKLAAKVLYRITTQFEGVMDMFNKCWPITKAEEAEILDLNIEETDLKDVFPCSDEERLSAPVVVQPENIAQYRLAQVNWLTLGQYITQVYLHLAETQQSMLYTMSYNDLIQVESNVTELSGNNNVVGETTETEDIKSVSEHSTNEDAETELIPEQNVATPQSATFASPSRSDAGKNNAEANANDDSDSNAKSDSNDSSNNKPKGKRRCSDLHMLEQWGWHKSRRYSSRKKAQDKVEVDTSLNAFLRKMFAKFTDKNFEQTWPFNKEHNDKQHKEDIVCQKCKGLKEVDLDSFVQATQKNLTNLIKRLQAQKFDLMFLIFEWLRELSPLYQLKLPEIIKSKYLEIFTLYLKHYDWSNWNLLGNADFEASYHICLLYLELDFELTCANNW